MHAGGMHTDWTSWRLAAGAAATTGGDPLQKRACSSGHPSCLDRSSSLRVVRTPMQQTDNTAFRDPAIELAATRLSPALGCSQLRRPAPLHDLPPSMEFLAKLPRVSSGRPSPASHLCTSAFVQEATFPVMVACHRTARMMIYRLRSSSTLTSRATAAPCSGANFLGAPGAAGLRSVSCESTR